VGAPAAMQSHIMGNVEMTDEAFELPHMRPETLAQNARSRAHRQEPNRNLRAEIR
jgi:hypothetical protein